MQETGSIRCRTNVLRGGLAVGALALAAGLAACGEDFAQPAQVESCLRQEGLTVTRQGGVSPPVETRINFAASGAPDSASSGFVTYYATEEDATRNLQAARGSAPEGGIERTGRVLYTSLGAEGGPGSQAVVANCVDEGEAEAEEDDDGSSSKRKKNRRRR